MWMVHQSSPSIPIFALFTLDDLKPASRSALSAHGELIRMAAWRRGWHKASGAVSAALGGKKEALLAVLSLLLLCTGFFANVLFTDRVLVSDSTGRYYPWEYYAPLDLHKARLNDAVDRVREKYPQLVVEAGMIREGVLPLWNPHLGSGMPLLAGDPLGGFFYPFNVIFYLVDPLRAFGYASLVQLFLAATFMYLYLKKVEFREPSALLGALVFGLGGFFLLYLNWIDRINTAVWMPLMFLSVEGISRGRYSWWALVLALTVGMAGLAGNFGVLAYELLALGAYSVWILFSRLRNGSRGQCGRIVLCLLAAAIAGTSLSAVQLIPSVEALPLTRRGQESYEQQGSGAPRAHCLAMAIFPDIYGNPVDRPGWGHHAFGPNCPGDYSESSIYAGFLPLVLSALAVAVKARGRVILFVALAALSLAIFVENSPVFRLLYVLPLFRYGRPIEAKVVYFFSVSVLAGAGLDCLLGLAEEERRKLARRVGLALCSFGLVVAIVAVFTGAVINLSGLLEPSELAQHWYVYNMGNLPRFLVLVFAPALLFILLARARIGVRLFIVLAITLVVADLFYFGWKFNPVRSPRDLYAETEGVQFLRADPDMFRVMRGPGGKEVLPPDLLEVYGISDAQDYSSLILSRYADFMEVLEEGIVGHWGIHNLQRAESMSSGLLDLLNVKYILSTPDGREDLSAFVEGDDNLQLVYRGDMRIYHNMNALPRAFVVRDHKVLHDRETILAELASDSFDPADYVILEEEPRLPPGGASASTVESLATIAEYTPNEVTVEAEMSSDGFLVLGDAYYPGWKVFVDGVGQILYKADYLFRGVQLEKGSHVVEFVFDPFSFKIGLCLTVLASAAACGWAVTTVPAVRTFGGA